MLVKTPKQIKMINKFNVPKLKNIYYVDKSGSKVIEKKASLNNGYFGKLYTMKSDIDGKIYAVKMLDIINLQKKLKIPKKLLMNNIKNESRILSKMDHKHIVRYYQTRITDNKVYIFMELISGGTLENIIKSGYIKPDLIKKLISELLSALDYIHNNIKIIHRDIKPDNIFIENESIKLGDFGLATTLLNKDGNYTQSNNIKGRGHVYYRSPESVKSNIYNCMHDIWAVGCIMLEMMSNLLIPSMIDDSNVFALSVQINDIIEQICEDYDNIDLTTVCKGFLNKDPLERMEIKEALLYLNKPQCNCNNTPRLEILDRPWTR